MVAFKEDFQRSREQHQPHLDPRQDELGAVSGLSSESRLSAQQAGTGLYTEERIPKKNLAALAAASRYHDERMEHIEEAKRNNGITATTAARITEQQAPSPASTLRAQEALAQEKLTKEVAKEPVEQTELQASRPQPAQAAQPEVQAQTTQPEESRSWWSSVKSIGKAVGGFVCDAIGVTKIVEGVREGDWKKLAIGTAQLVGTGLAFMTGAGLGMIVAGAVLQNAGTIVAAVSSGSPAAIAGAVLAVGLSVVLSKYGNVLAEKIMSKVAPVSQEVVKEGMLKVGEGLGKRVGAEIIAEKGAEKVTALGVEAGTKAAQTFSKNLESFAGAAVETAKLQFGAAAKEVGEVASQHARELAVKSLTPEIDLVMNKLGVTDRVANVVSKELVEKAANAGVLGQMGFGGGRVLSYLGLGNSSLRKSIEAAAPELGEEGAKQLAKHLCRAVQQKSQTELVKESLSTGITSGLRSSLKETLEDPMKHAFMNGIAPSVKQFAQRHGIETFEHKMMQGAGVGFDDAYGAVLAKHVRAGVDRAFERKSGSRAGSGAVATVTAHEFETTETKKDTGDTKVAAEKPREQADVDGGNLGSRQETVHIGDTIVTRHLQKVRGAHGEEWLFVSESAERIAAAHATTAPPEPERVQRELAKRN